jgi:hypothetical protein
MIFLKALLGVFGAVAIINGLYGIGVHMNKLIDGKDAPVLELLIFTAIIVVGIIMIIVASALSGYSNYVPKLQRWPDYIAPWAIGINNRFPEQNIYKELGSAPQ